MIAFLLVYFLLVIESILLTIITLWLFSELQSLTRAPGMSYNERRRLNHYHQILIEELHIWHSDLLRYQPSS